MVPKSLLYNKVPLYYASLEKIGFDNVLVIYACDNA